MEVYTELARVFIINTPVTVSISVVIILSISFSLLLVVFVIGVSEVDNHNSPI